MKIYLIRHGQTDCNLKRIYSSDDIDLNKNGIIQANQMRDKLNEIEYDVVICSPLQRAVHTANIINVKDKNIIIDERLRERSSGNLKGCSYELTDREEYWNYYSDIQYGTSESISSLFERVRDFLDDLKYKEYENVVIVAHNGISKAFYAYFNGIPKDGRFLNLGVKNIELKEYSL